MKKLLSVAALLSLLVLASCNKESTEAPATDDSTAVESTTEAPATDVVETPAE